MRALLVAVGDHADDIRRHLPGVVTVCVDSFTDGARGVESESFDLVVTADAIGHQQGGSGLVLARMCRPRDIPCIIVTSEPVESAPYGARVWWPGLNWRSVLPG